MSGIFSAFFVLSHSFPRAWYQEKAFQRQRKYLFVVFMAEEGIHMAYFGLELAFVHVPAAYQWILALLLIPLQDRAGNELCKDSQCPENAPTRAFSLLKRFHKESVKTQDMGM